MNEPSTQIAAQMDEGDRSLMTVDPILNVRNLRKGFGGVPVLRDVSFALSPGEVIALAGENGAGKSTVMKIVSGLVDADDGEVEIEGTVHDTLDPHKARALGISIVPQELAPYPDLMVYENIFVGRELRTKFGLLDRHSMISQARSMLDVFDVDIDPKVRMRDLSVAMTQLVEIVKATTWDAKVILLDEPTSAIPEQEVDQLYGVVRKLQAQGVAMLYTTHRMAEIQELADRVVVLRDGYLVMDEPLQRASEETIVKAMIGRDLDTTIAEPAPPLDEIGLAVTGLQLEQGGPAVDLTVRRGEILGLGGLVGSGRTETLEAILGFRRSTAGTISVRGHDIPRNAPGSAIGAGIAIIPEDRKGAGLVLQQSVLNNVSLPHISAFTKAGWIRSRQRRDAVQTATDSVSVKCRGLDQSVGTLSGGNQQKVVIARWLTQNASVLLLDEPTRGVDVGAREEIYRIIRDLAASGLAIVLVSSDMPELIGLSHRVQVFRGGQIVGELSRADLDEDDVQEKFFRLASGLELHNVGSHGA